MPKSYDIQHSVLIVTASEQIEAMIKKSLKGSVLIETRRTASLARRCILERYFDLIVICIPLPDEPGVELALDAAEKCSASVLILSPQEVFDDVVDRVTDQGILVCPRQPRDTMTDRAIRYLLAVQKRVHLLEGKIATMEEKMEEQKLTSKAKLLLIQKKKMSEDEAHRYIGKEAMNNGVSRKRVAERIIDLLE